MDEILSTRTVMFVGDYFTLMTTVVLDEKLREENESDEDFAVRVASIFMREYYGFDVEEVSIHIGIVDDEGIKVREDE
jgi:hypothetical protein